MRQSTLAIGILLALIFLISSMPSPAQAWTVDGECLNGNQEIIYDAGHDLVCRGVPATGEVVLQDVTAGNATTIQVGYAPTSMDISSNGSVLYVAVSEQHVIAVIDLASRSLERLINLSLAPDSVCEWRSDLLLFSGMHDGEVYSYNLTTSVEAWAFGAGTRSCLQANPDHQQLLVFSLGYNGGLFTRYLAAGDGFAEAARAQYGVSYMAQMVVDWEGGMVYVGSTLDNQLRQYALSDLSLVAGVVMPGICTGLIAIPDQGLLLYTMRAEGGGSHGVQVDLGSLRQSCWIRLPGNGPYAWASASKTIVDSTTGVTASPAPGAMQVTPSDGAVLAYSPGSIVVSGDLGLIDPNGLGIELELDGVPQSFYVMLPQEWQIWLPIPSMLAEGPHTVHVRANNAIGSSEVNSTFRIDRTLPSSRPVAVPVSPANGSTMYAPPSDLVFDVINAGIPVSTNISVEMNGVYCSFSQDGEGHYHVQGPYYVDGWNAVNITLHYDGQSAPFFWEFRIGGVEVRVAWPGVDSVCVEEPTEVGAWLGGDIPSGDLTFRLDGMPLVTTWLNHSAIAAAISGSLVEGTHTVTLWSGPDSILFSWDFGVQYLQVHSYQGRFNISLPATWEIQEGVDLGGTKAAFVAKGPTINGFQTNIIIQIGNDRTVHETVAFMSGLASDMVQEMKDQGMQVQMRGEPHVTTVSGHTAVLFNVSWSAGFTQMIEVVVSEKSQEYWTVIYSVSGAAPNWNEALFQAVGGSLEVTSSDVLMQGWELALCLCVVVGLIAVAVLLSRRWNGGQ
jgi:hypothetical protein